MKKFLFVVPVIILALSVIIASFSASAANASDVGKLAGSIIFPIDGIDSSNINTVRKLIIKEYQRGITTASVKDKGNSYFDYGESTKEYVHPWVGSKQYDQSGNEYYNSCMAQDFTSDEVIEPEWNCILVTLDSLAKGEAYTVRDGIAKSWGDAGAVSSTWGMPTNNQKWIHGKYIENEEGWYCYQTFTFGYALSFEGMKAYTRFYRYDEGNAPPSGGDYDFPPRSIPSDDVTSPSYYIPSSDASSLYGKLYDEIGASDNMSSGFLPVNEEHPDQSSPDILLAETQNSSGEGNDSDSGDSMGASLNSKKDAVGRTDSSKGGWVKILLIVLGIVVILGGIAAIIVIHTLKKKQRRITATEDLGEYPEE